jgi:uncharacterized membrane protein YraQ (UPF0718 family)
MNRVWAFAANAALVFGGLSIAIETVLGHDPETIARRACGCVLAAGLAGFLFRWLLERGLQTVQAKAEAAAQALPAAAKASAAAAPAAAKTGR